MQNPSNLFAKQFKWSVDGNRNLVASVTQFRFIRNQNARSVSPIVPEKLS